MSKILVIDDDPSICELVRHYLEKVGHDVTIAHDGREGIDVFSMEHFDLVIVDIFMPRKDGIETILELREQNKNACIMAISGGGKMAAGKEYLSYAKALGADCILSKPFAKSQLLQAVSELTAPETS
ncbi:MAG: response regulator transcription factor [Desulfovibrio sp.]|uniref:response regulator transcription factor n=1 Tax=Desulfovibrio sp. 7SRBS1 TaxID=3378064 RepID=UPI003B3D4848